MAKVIDLRSTGGELYLLGGALVLPTSDYFVPTPVEGSLRYNTSLHQMEIWNGSSWINALGSSVTSFNTRTGAVVLLSSDVTSALGYTPVDPAVEGAPNGIATLDGSGKLTASQIPSSLIGVVVYQGVWNATTNSPTLTSSTGTKGFYYVVSVAGSTNLDGITDWSAGDVAIFNGATWDKIDGNTHEVLSVAGKTGIVTLDPSDIVGLLTLIGGSSTVSTVGGTVTLSSGQYSVGTVIVTGALVSPAIIVVPDNGKWVISNRTSGGQTLTIKTAAGTGVTVDQGYSTEVVADGMNCIYANNDPLTTITLTGAVTGSGTAAITTTFASISNNTLLANTSGSANPPVETSLTTLIDNAIDNTQGDILYRGASAWAALAPSTAGYVLQTNGPSANPSWTALGLASLPSIANNTILSNVSGVTTTPSANTLTAIFDSALDNTQGDIIYRGASSWGILGHGTNGQYLKTQGASANPVWGDPVTSVATGTGLTGGPITTTGTISFASVSDSRILANISGSSAASVPNTISDILDHTLDNTQGDIIYRANSVWTVLGPGTSGKFLQTGGASANPAWATAVTSVATSGGLSGGPITTTGTISLASVADGSILANISGGSTNPSANTLSDIIDHVLSSTEGAILYRDASAWSALGPGTSGQYLQTKGTSQIPVWDTVDYTDLPTEVKNSLAQISIPGLQPANTKCLIVPIVQNTQVPANFAGSAGYCGSNATGSAAFTVSYIHSGSPSTIGTFTFSSGGGSTPALSTQIAVNLVSGDVLIVTTPTSADTTLADVGITLLLLKQ